MLLELDMKHLLRATSAIGLVSLTAASRGQVTREHLATTLPNEVESSQVIRISFNKNTHKFGRMMPKGEMREPQTGLPMAEHVVHDEFELNVAYPKAPFIGRVTQKVTRHLFSTDNLFRLRLHVVIAETPEMADIVMGRHSGGSGIETLGTFSNEKMLGDYSWTLGGDGSGSALDARSGRLILAVDLSQTVLGRNQDKKLPFQPHVLEAVACRIFLAASRIPTITGVESKKWSLEINGKTVTKVSAIEVANRTFVSPLALCKAAGITAVWNTDMSTVDIKRGELVRLFPGSVETIQGNGPGKKLKLPPFMDGDKCMMDLDDLLTVLGGSRVTEGDKIAIRL